MKSTPKWIAGLGVVVSILVELLHYISTFKLPEPASLHPADASVWYDIVARVQPSTNWLILLLAIFAAILSLLGYALGESRYRKTLVAQQLEECACHFSTNKTAHRFTVFRKVSGWRVMAAVLYRNVFYRQDHFSSDWRKRFRGMWINPLYDYLLPYVRPRNSVNAVSCSAFRISDRPSLCEGIAGQVWTQDALTKSTTVSFDDGALRNIKELDEYPDDDPVRIYAEETNIQSAWRLRAMERYARHFYGCVIQGTDGEKIGVILMDSTQLASPFPTARKVKSLDKKMAKEAQAISRLLS